MKKIKQFLKSMRLIDTGSNVNKSNIFTIIAKELHQLTD